MPRKEESRIDKIRSKFWKQAVLGGSFEKYADAKRRDFHSKVLEAFTKNPKDINALLSSLIGEIGAMIGMIEVKSKIEQAIDRTIQDVLFDHLTEQSQREAETRLGKFDINEFLVDKKRPDWFSIWPEYFSSSERSSRPRNASS